MPRKKLEKSELLHGKQETQPLTMDEVWGSSATVYKHKSLEDYQEYIENLNKIDLLAHCTRVGIKPSSGNRSLVLRKLTRAFIEFNSKRNTKEPKSNIENQVEAQKKISKLIG
jgi:hypothetical protein